VARRGGSQEVDRNDEEFVFHLTRGADLLARGEAEPATASLESALELRPKDAKVLGLLGQAFYKLNRYEDAIIAWQRLVDDNPVEPAARVNLGLAFLKAKQFPEARRQLEIALDLNPDHKKAMGYLGLALLEDGDASLARGWFQKAGSDQMVARCDEVLAGGARPGAAAEAAVETEPPPVPEPIHTPLPGKLRAVPVEPPAEAPAPAATLAPGEATALGAYAASRVVHAGGEDTFAVRGSVLAVLVRGEVRIRLDGLFACRGNLSIAGEMKRFRGRPTETPFGQGETRMHRAGGEGVLLYRVPAGRRLTVLDLGPDAAYLRGQGRFLLATAGEPVAVEVLPDAPLRVPLDALVGWVGALTPRVTGLLEEQLEPGVVAVELAGEGRVLADPAAVRQGAIVPVRGGA